MRVLVVTCEACIGGDLPGDLEQAAEQLPLTREMFRRVRALAIHQLRAPARNQGIALHRMAERILQLQGDSHVCI
jgi:hypothetical protein